MRRLLAASATVFLIGAAQSAEAPRTADAQARFDKYMTGRVAGERRSCLPLGKTNEPIGIDEHILLFRDGPRIWRNDLRRNTGCEKLGKRYSMVTSTAISAGRLCSGAVAGVVDMHDPTVAEGACELGDFTLYQKP